MSAYMFPGQGSQVKGMGEALFKEFPTELQEANDILGYDLRTLCLEDPEDKLNQTNYTQPALYVVNCMSYMQIARAAGKRPDYVIGHSLGEYNALFAARVFTFETGLRLVQKRGELMNQIANGGMAAVVGLSAKDVKSVLEKNNLNELSIANYNSEKQIVLSGSKKMISAAETIFVSAGAKLYVPLKVSGAFHSSFMDDAAKEFSIFLQKFNFKKPEITVIANVTAKPYVEDAIAQTLAEQINHSVLWVQTIQYLLAKGVTSFQEVGPGKVLAGLLTRIQKGQ